MKPYIVALDQGTTSSRAILFDGEMKPIQTTQKEFKQYYPKPGWVEHDAEEIWSSQKEVLLELLQGKGSIEKVSCIGITNQRETTVLWQKSTGKPIAKAIVWQDRRTSNYCDQLRAEGKDVLIKEKTGLVLDAYFSATKIRYLLNHTEGARTLADSGDLAFGTIDSWLVWKLSGGEKHITDVSNASRTMLYNIHSLSWDDELLDLFDIPKNILPEVVASSGALAKTHMKELNLDIPITGIAGDQQSALFGQLCLKEGMVKCTYGTGCFLVMNTGSKAQESNHGLLTTIGWQIGDQVSYALEGSVFVGGAIIQWLRDGLGLIQNASESEALAMEVEDTDDVVVVPALTGLGAPHWDQYARGIIVGLTRGTNKAHIVRAALESIALQVKDVISAMEADHGMEIKNLRGDGGAVANRFLMQFQANILGQEVVVPKVTETTALGAALLAGLGLGIWKNSDDLEKVWSIDQVYHPKMNADERRKKYNRWLQAVERAKKWEEV